MQQKTISAAMLGTMMALSSSMLWANDFEFDRPGEGLGTGIVPKGHLAWEQSLPTASYDKRYIDGVKHQSVTVQGDVLLRLGVAKDLELRLGWDGPMWQEHKVASSKIRSDGVGDLQVGVKKAIDLKDEKLKLALLAEINLATGDDEFSSEEEIYTLASALSYQFSEQVNTSLTMLYEYQDGDLAVTAIPSVSYPISGNVAGFSEYVFRKAEHQSYESAVNTGLIWAVSDKLQLDAVLGYSFNQQRPDFNVGLGLAYLF